MTLFVLNTGPRPTWWTSHEDIPANLPSQLSSIQIKVPIVFDEKIFDGHGGYIVSLKELDVGALQRG